MPRAVREEAASGLGTQKRWKNQKPTAAALARLYADAVVRRLAGVGQANATARYAGTETVAEGVLREGSVCVLAHLTSTACSQQRIPQNVDQHTRARAADLP
ncbi:MAG: hypothetical protein WAZ34_08890 [Rhodocyclaceae bacterium]